MTKGPACPLHATSLRRGRALAGAQFVPFIQGPRNCLGQYFALLEARIVLALLVKAREARLALSPYPIPCLPPALWPYCKPRGAAALPGCERTRCRRVHVSASIARVCRARALLRMTSIQVLRIIERDAASCPPSTAIMMPGPSATPLACTDASDSCHCLKLLTVLAVESGALL